VAGVKGILYANVCGTESTSTILRSKKNIFRVPRQLQKFFSILKQVAPPLDDRKTSKQIMRLLFSRLSSQPTSVPMMIFK
jgi:hypothetical protein